MLSGLGFLPPQFREAIFLLIFTGLVFIGRGLAYRKARIDGQRRPPSAEAIAELRQEAEAASRFARQEAMEGFRARSDWNYALRLERIWLGIGAALLGTAIVIAVGS